MSSSFSVGTWVVVPRLVDGYRHSRDSRTAFATVPGADAALATVFPASMRNGTMTAVFDNLADAIQLDTMLKGTLPIMFTDSESVQLNMTFLLSGRASLEQSAGRGAWLVTFDFQEVAP